MANRETWNPTRRSWRKLHIGVDATLPSKDVDDATHIGPLLDQIDRPITSLAAAGAYDQDGIYSDVLTRQPNAAVVVPRQYTAVLTDLAETAPTQHDRCLQVIAKRGHMSWQRAFGYNWRALVEADNGRFNRLIGDALQLKTDFRRMTRSPWLLAS